MITSERYAASLPDWVQQFNDDRVVDRFVGRPWTRLAPAAEYDKRCRRDDFEHEWGRRYTGTNTFPHRTGLSDAAQADAAYYRAVYFSPFGNDVLLELARRGVDAMQLGRRGVTDLLLVSLSSNDLVGHAYGPLSHEVMDVTFHSSLPRSEGVMRRQGPFSKASRAARIINYFCILAVFPIMIYNSFWNNSDF